MDHVLTAQLRAAPPRAARTPLAPPEQPQPVHVRAGEVSTLSQPQGHRRRGPERCGEWRWLRGEPTRDRGGPNYSLQRRRRRQRTLRGQPCACQAGEDAAGMLQKSVRPTFIHHCQIRTLPGLRARRRCDDAHREDFFYREAASQGAAAASRNET